MEQVINVTEAQVRTLGIITGFEGRGRQGLAEESISEAGADRRVLSNLVERGLVGTRERWGRTFFHVTKEGRRVLGA